MSENFEEMQFTPANGKPLITVVKGIKPDKPVIEKTIHNLATRVCSLSLRSRLLELELGRLKKDLEEAISLDASKESTVNANDDISECSNSLSDFENDSDDDSDSDTDSDAVSDLNAEECKVMHKVYHINLNFN